MRFSVKADADVTGMQDAFGTIVIQGEFSLVAEENFVFILVYMDTNRAAGLHTNFCYHLCMRRYLDRFVVELADRALPIPHVFDNG